MNPSIHPLLSAAFALTDASADNVRAVAAELVAGRATLDELLSAVDTFSEADRELRAIQALRLVVNGRTYTLRRPATGDVRGEA